MSLFNFNPSGFLGSGAFTLDPSKFNFSNISVPSTTPDPMDIVAPEPEPEVKYSPVVEQATQGGMLSGNVDLGMDFGLGDTQVSTDNFMSQDNLALAGSGSGFDVPQGEPYQQAVERRNENIQLASDVFNSTFEAPKFDFSFLQGMTRDSGLISKEYGQELARSMNAYLDSEDYTNDLSSYISSVREQGVSKNELSDRELETKFLADQGIKAYSTEGVLQGIIKDPETGRFKFEDRSEMSDIGKVVKTIAEAGILVGTGAGVTGAMAGSAVGTGVTNAVVNAGLQQAMTGDVDLIQAATAGFNAGLNSYAGATKAATEAASVVGATAEMADTARNMQSTLEVLETVKDTINLAEAIDDKNVLGAIDISLGMADLPNTKTFVADKLQETFPDSDIVTRHADSLASATIKTGVKLAEGESVGDAVKSGLLEYVKQGGGLGIDMPDINFEIDFGIGESDMLERIDQWVRDLPTTKEDWERWEDNVKNSADAVVRALPTTKEDWQNLEQVIKDGAEVVKTTVVDPVVTVVRETGRAIEEGYDTVEDFVKEDVVPVLDPIYETLRDAEEAGERFVQGLGDNLPELPDAEGVDMPDINRPSFSTPNIALDLLGSSEGGLLSQDELAKMRMGDQYVFDLNLYSNLRNPLLNS